MESTKEKRVWHSGPPPHVGWWNASAGGFLCLWRWWDGATWSDCVNCDVDDANSAAQAARIPEKANDIRWSDYWPENARVPRVDPSKA